MVADGWTYSQWVVGSSRMRAVDPEWPAPGSRLEHSIGAWPGVINDETVVEECNPLEELVLRAGLGPMGGARITLRLSDASSGCCAEMGEVAVRGLLRRLPHSLQEPAFNIRNRECLWRLAALAERLRPGEVR